MITMGQSPAEAREWPQGEAGRPPGIPRPPPIRIPRQAEAANREAGGPPNELNDGALREHNNPFAK